MFIPFALRWLMSSRRAKEVKHKGIVKLPEAQVIEMIEPEVCRYCGSGMGDYDKFCQYCGAKR